MLNSKRHRRYEDLKFTPKARNLEGSLEQALKEAVDDATLRKIKRVSYSANAATEVMNLLIFNCSDNNCIKLLLTFIATLCLYKLCKEQCNSVFNIVHIRFTFYATN